MIFSLPYGVLRRENSHKQPPFLTCIIILYFLVAIRGVFDTIEKMVLVGVGGERERQWQKETPRMQPVYRRKVGPGCGAEAGQAEAWRRAGMRRRGGPGS